MSSTAPQNTSNQTAPAAGSSATVVRVILFAILGYLLFALAYDYLYMFKAHEAKYQELSELAAQEASRPAEDIKTKGATGPAEIQKIIGFAPSVPLTKEDGQQYEKYSYRDALLFRTRDLWVYYGGDPLRFTGVAHTEEEKIGSLSPDAPAPTTDPAPPATMPGSGKTDKKKAGAEEPAPEEPAEKSAETAAKSDDDADNQPAADTANKEE